MYKVYRCVEGVLQRHVGEYATLAEAYAQAKRKAADAESRFVRYRILGRIPQELSDGSNESAPRVWYVLDDDTPMPKGAIRASEVLARLGDTSAVDVRRVRPSDAPAETIFYRVDRVAKGVRQTIRDGFMTESEARAWLSRWVGKRRDPQANFIIVAPTKPPRPTKRQRRVASDTPPDEAMSYRVDLVTHGMSHTIRAGIPTRHEAKDFIARWKRRNRHRQAQLVIVASTTRSDSERRERSEREGRRDLSLLGRPEDELGLGIPAQWGKGRRSRKGDYIP